MFRNTICSIVVVGLLLCNNVQAQSLGDHFFGSSPSNNPADPKLDARLPDVPLKVTPRRDVDERLFLMRVLENMYDSFPVESDKAALTKSLADFRHEANRLHDYVKAKNTDATVTALYVDLLKTVDAYIFFLAESDIIEKQAIARAEKESAETGYSAGFAGGAVGAELYKNQGYSGGDAALAGLATAAIAYLWNDYNKGKVRDEAKQQAVEAAIERLKTNRSTALAHAENSANDLTERYGWKKGEAGFDVDDNDRQQVARLVQANDVDGLGRFFDAVHRRRPRDPFVIVQTSMIKCLRPKATPNDLASLARNCVEAASLVPDGRFYDEYRATILCVAGYIANHAWMMEFQDTGFENANNKKAKWAVRIWDACLTYDPKDSSGEKREERAWALMGSGRLGEALIQANEVVDLRKNGISYALQRTYLLSCLHEKESILWFEHAVRNLGYNDIAQSKKDPDMAWMRQAEAARFAAVTNVKFEWTIDWGFLSDDIVFTNKSPFAITNAKLTVRVKSTGDTDWLQAFQVDSIEPGQTHKWNTRISSRGDDAQGTASLNCDQNQ